MGVPPPSFGSFGIKDLGGGSRQVFGFKGLAGKVFKKQKLRLSRSAENGFGAVSRAVLVDGRASKLPQSDLYGRALRVLSQRISSMSVIAMLRQCHVNHHPAALTQAELPVSLSGFCSSIDEVVRCDLHH